MNASLRCKISGRVFDVSDQEIELRATIGVPLPTLCPEEVSRRVLARRNERVLYRRKCSATGQSIISIHSEKVPFPVYNQDYWWTDKWDSYSYGRDYDFSRGFFEQFAELYSVVPQLSLNSPNCENSEWNNQSCDLKNCYMMFCSGFSEDCLYGMWNTNSKNCVDCSGAFDCNWCYQLVNSHNCFQCRNCDNCEQCFDCYFSRDLISCSDCIGCVGLQHKRWHIFNKSYSKEEFEKRKTDLNLGSRAASDNLANKFKEFQKNFPRRYYNGHSADDSSGDYLIRTLNCQNTYNFRESKNLINCRDGWKSNDSIGLLETYTQDHCIEIEGSVGGTNCGFCNKIWDSGNIWYSSHIYYSKDIFGCVGLRNAEQCILNKRYSKEQFKDLRKRIVAQMKENGEWGENFPIKDSPFAYNLSMGQEYFPLTKEQILERGYRWEEPQETKITSDRSWSVPDHISDLSVIDALQQVVKCERSGKLFKFQKAELEFYKNQGIPAPVVHDQVRFYERMGDRRNPRKLNDGQCFLCGKKFQTTYTEDSGCLVACEKCYSEKRDEEC